MPAISVTATVTDASGEAGTATATATIGNSLIVGASSNKPSIPSNEVSMVDLDSHLATAAGVSPPVLRFWHTYSGTTFPASFSSSTVANAPGHGWAGMLNTKMTSGQVRTTAGRTTVNNFLASVPASFKLWLIFRHEPENDNLSAADKDAWCRDFAEFAKLVIDFGNPNITPCSCMMAAPPAASPWDDFNYVPYLRAGDQAKLVWLFDGYPKCRTGPDRTDEPGVKYDPPMAWARAHGFTRLGIAETTLNNDANIAQSFVDAWWRTKLPAWLAANPIEILAVYDSTGPAAGTNGLLDTAGEWSALADLALNRI